ncbi:MAG: c-type cytochrome, partial [Usitatibacter sp.]
PSNLIHIVRDGILPGPHEARPWMPEFRHALTDDELAELLAYLRTMSGKEPWQDVRGEVRRVARETR